MELGPGDLVVSLDIARYWNQPKVKISLIQSVNTCNCRNPNSCKFGLCRVTKKKI